MIKKDFLQKEINWLLQEKYQGKPAINAKKDILRLKKGEPLAYLIGSIDFLGAEIDLSKKPLIPRPETEFWAEKVILAMKQCKLPVKCLDIFAGSGCIGIALLKNLPRAKVDFSEKEKIFLTQIKINLKINKINQNRARLIKSDIFSNIEEKYDYIFANPPYVANNKKHLVQKSVLEYEPRKALLAGENGLFYIEKFLKEAKNYLRPNGKIYLEFSPEQKTEIAKLLKNYGYQDFEFKKDQYGKWRVLVISS